MQSSKEFASRVFSTVYMGTENSSAETRERAQRLAGEIGAAHLDTRIDSIVAAMVALFHTITGPAETEAPETERNRYRSTASAVQTAPEREQRCAGKTPRFKSAGGSNAENLALQNIQVRPRCCTTCQRCCTTCQRCPQGIEGNCAPEHSGAPPLLHRLSRIVRVVALQNIHVLRCCYRSTGKVLQTLNIGKSPGIPNHLIIYGATHEHIREHCSGVAHQHYRGYGMQARLRMVLAFLLAQLLPWIRGASGFLLVLGSANVHELLRGQISEHEWFAAQYQNMSGLPHMTGATLCRRACAWCSRSC